MSNRRLSIPGIDLAFYAVTQQTRGSAMGKTIMLGACLLLSSLLTGCSLFGDQHVINLSIQTDETTYEVKENQPLGISYIYHNQGPNAVYLGTCLGGASHQLEKLVEGAWITAYSPNCPSILTPALRIRPGERYTTTLRLVPADWDPDPRNSTWHGGDDIAGTYRVPELVYSDWSIKQFDAGTLPQPKMVYSNSFEVRRQP